jgi:hypothetical protein
MHRRILAIVTCLAFFISSPGFAQDRDATSRDVSGIPKSHRYFWSVAGGTAVGLALGIIAPGGSKSAFKGALIGGSATSAFYLIKDPNAAGGERGFAHLLTNTLLGTSVFWTICDCSAGAASGALIGGGGTALIQSFGTHNRSLAKLGGISQSTPPPSAPGAPSTNPLSSGMTAAEVAAQVQTVPAQPQTTAQTMPASTQSALPATQNASAGPVQDQPPLDPEYLIFSNNSGSESDKKFGSVTSQTTLTKPQ